MRRSFAIWLLLATCVTGAAQPADAPAPLTLDQYIQALDAALAAARQIKEEPQKADDLVKSLPPAWQVEVDGKSFEVSSDSLRRDLGGWQKKPDQAAFDRVIRYLETLRYQAGAYGTPLPDISRRHALLNNILARSEFRNVHGETWLDRLKQRLTELLLRILGHVISSAAVPAISNIIVYGLIALAVLALAYWMYRSVRDSARLETLMPVAMPVSAKEWPIWMTEARAAAGRGDWRDAVHLAYWGGISFLEAGGAWRPDVARTPREYLRLLPAASSRQPSLRALTVRLETVWYGMQTADADAFQQTLAELERMGCPCR